MYSGDIVQNYGVNVLMLIMSLPVHLLIDRLPLLIYTDRIELSPHASVLVIGYDGR